MPLTIRKRPVRTTQKRGRGGTGEESSNNVGTGHPRLVGTTYVTVCMRFYWQDTTLLCVRYPFVATEMADKLFAELLPVDAVQMPQSLCVFPLLSPDLTFACACAGPAR
jgi:hypothetical protein